MEVKRHSPVAKGFSAGVQIIRKLRTGLTPIAWTGRQETCHDPQTFQLEFPQFPGQVEKGHAMTIRLSIDDFTHQEPTPVHGATEGGGC
jgi:hypothetical protein